MIVLIDTETTSLTKAMAASPDVQPKMIQFAAICMDYDLETVRRYNRYINPGVQVPADVVKKTGITNEFLADKPFLEEVWDEILDFIGCAQCLVAHNLPFDLDVLRIEGRRMKSVNPIPPFLFCTAEASRLVGDEMRRMSLGDLYQHYTGQKIQGWHRADNDVETLAVCLEGMTADNIFDPYNYFEYP